MCTYSYWFSLYYIIVIIVIYRCFVLSCFMFLFFGGVSYHLGFISGGEWISSIDMEMPGQLFLEMGVHMGMVWISMDICMNV